MVYQYAMEFEDCQDCGSPTQVGNTCCQLISKTCGICNNDIVARCYMLPELACPNVVEEFCPDCEEMVRGRCRHIMQCRIRPCWTCFLCQAAEPGAFTKTRLYPSCPEWGWLAEHYYTATDHYFNASLCSAPRWRLTVASVDYVVNSAQMSKFEAKKQQFRSMNVDSTPVLLFHGTPEFNIDSILRDNFRLEYVKRTVHGFGFYFTCLPDVAMHFSRPRRSILLCQVLVGRLGVNSKRIMHRNPVSGGRCPAYVIGLTGGTRDDLSMDQILPSYVINFS